MRPNQHKVVAEIAALEDHFWTISRLDVLPRLSLLPYLSIVEFEDGPAIPTGKLAGNSRTDLRLRGRWTVGFARQLLRAE